MSEHEYSEPERTGFEAFGNVWRESRAIDPRSSITGVSIGKCYGGYESDLEERQPSRYEVRAGLDWLKVYVYGELQDGEAQTAYFHELKKEALKDTENRFFEVGDVSVEMASHGIGKMRHSHAFFFKGPGVDVSVAETFHGELDERQTRAMEEQKDRTRPTAMIEFKGQACYGRSVESIVQEVYWWCMQLGVKEPEARISRVDIAVDWQGRAVSDVFTRFAAGGIVTRARDKNIHLTGNRVTGIEFAKPSADTRLRIYDKVLELRKNPEKLAAWESAYGRLNGDPITRYEWQLKRKALTNQHQISDVEDLRTKIASLTEYLTSEWYRETDEGDQRQSNRRGEREFSQFRSKAIKSLGGKKLERRRSIKVAAPIEGLVQQGYGCLSRVAAILGEKIQEPTDLIAIIWPQWIQEHRNKLERTEQKMLEEKTRRAYQLQDNTTFEEHLRDAYEKVVTTVMRRLSEHESPLADSAYRWQLGMGKAAA